MKRAILAPAIFLFAAVFGAGACFAEPSPTVKYLMEERCSLFDMGIVQLKYDLADFAGWVVRLNTRPDWARKYDDFLNNGVVSGVHYDFGSNTIKMELVFPTYAQVKEERIRAFSLDFLDQLRHRFGVDGKTGKYIDPNFPQMESYFNHKGYKGPKEPRDMAKELDTIVEVSLKIKDRSWQTLSECRGKLVGSDAAFSK